MSRSQKWLLDLALKAFPRSVRKRDGAMLMSVAAEMIDDGKSAWGQSINLLLAGIVARARAIGAAPSTVLLRDAVVAFAGLCSPLLVIATAATLMATLLTDTGLGNNRSPIGFNLDAYWMLHVGLPWTLVLGGGVLATLGFYVGRRGVARIGSIGSCVGAWLVIGSMGGWLPGSGFYGPAELPFLSSSYEVGPGTYVIAPIGAMTALMVLGSLLAPRGHSMRDQSKAWFSASIVGIYGLGTMMLTPFLGADVLAPATAIVVGWLWMLPILGGSLRRNDASKHLAQPAIGIGLIVFAIPSLVLASQVIQDIASIQDWIVLPALLSLVPIMLITGVGVIVRSLLRSRATT